MILSRRYHVRPAACGFRFAVWDTSRPKWSCVKIFDTEEEALAFADAHAPKQRPKESGESATILQSGPADTVATCA